MANEREREYEKGVFLVFSEQADGDSCYEYDEYDYKMNVDIRGDKLLSSHTFEQACARAKWVLRSSQEVEAFIEKFNNEAWFDQECQHEIQTFLRTHLCAGNAKGKSRLIVEKVMSKNSVPYTVSDITFHVYWLCRDHMPGGVSTHDEDDDEDGLINGWWFCDGCGNVNMEDDTVCIEDATTGERLARCGCDKTRTWPTSWA